MIVRTIQTENLVRLCPLRVGDLSSVSEESKSMQMNRREWFLEKARSDADTPHGS